VCRLCAKTRCKAKRCFRFYLSLSDARTGPQRLEFKPAATQSPELQPLKVLEPSLPNAHCLSPQSQGSLVGIRVTVVGASNRSSGSLYHQRHPQQCRRKDYGEQAIETVRAEPGHIEHAQHIREHRQHRKRS